MHRGWHPVGTGLDSPQTEEHAASDRRAYTSGTGTAADAAGPTDTDSTADTRIFSTDGAEFMSLIFVPRDSTDVAYAVPSGSFTVRLYWYDKNSGEWVPETSTITIPHASAPSANKNHEEQRATYGHELGAVVVETKTDATDILHVHANGARAA